MLALVIIEGIAIGILAILVFGLLRSHALILRALHELGAGLELDREAQAATSKPGPVPVELERGVVRGVERDTQHAANVIGNDLAQQQVQFPVDRGRTLLAFLSSGCSICQDFWNAFADGVTVPAGARLVVVTRSAEEESISALRELAGDTVPVAMSSAAWTDYDIPGSPYFLCVQDGQIVGEGSAGTWEQVADLMSQAITDAQTSITLTDDRDNTTRLDAELTAAGIHPGHESLFTAPDATAHTHQHLSR